MIAFSSDVLSLMLLQFTVRIRRFLLGGRFGIDVDSVLDLFVLLGSFLWDLLFLNTTPSQTVIGTESWLKGGQTREKSNHRCNQIIRSIP
jgi:hypothetical protein